MKNTVVIIGCGNVGMSYAYALLNQGTKVNEIILIDINQERIKGEAEDLNHGLPFAPSKIKIRVGDYKDCANASIVCIAAGANQNPGETRMDLIKKNNSIFKDIVVKVVASGFNGIFLIATNPLDVMTYLTYKHSLFHPSKIIGSGTILDTARLRYLIGGKLCVNSKNIHAYVMGEHGDSEFVAWSNSYVGTTSIYDFLSEEELESIAYDVKMAAYDIIKQKGATYYGIGMSLVRITNAILAHENSILTVSAYDEENDIFIGQPVVISREGVVKKVPIKLSDKEQILFDNSVNVIKEAIESIK